MPETNQDCSCSTTSLVATQSFGDCTVFCDAQGFDRFHYESTTSTCSCCDHGATQASNGNVYFYLPTEDSADSADSADSSDAAAAAAQSYSGCLAIVAFGAFSAL
eukprot:Skav222734  [mRNA]  locus=scaffold2390:317120:317434:+ [translate_table: standard]